MGQYVQQVPVKFQSFPVGIATPVVLDVQSYPFPLSVHALPGALGSLLVEYSLTPDAAGDAAANWNSWPSSSVTVSTTDVLIAPVSALRFTASDVAGIVEVNG